MYFRQKSVILSTVKHLNICNQHNIYVYQFTFIRLIQDLYLPTSIFSLSIVSLKKELLNKHVDKIFLVLMFLDPRNIETYISVKNRLSNFFANSSLFVHLAHGRRMKCSPRFLATKSKNL